MRYACIVRVKQKYLWRIILGEIKISALPKGRVKLLKAQFRYTLVCLNLYNVDTKNYSFKLEKNSFKNIFYIMLLTII